MACRADDRGGVGNQQCELPTWPTDKSAGRCAANKGDEQTEAKAAGQRSPSKVTASSADEKEEYIMIHVHQQEQQRIKHKIMYMYVHVIQV